ncbi:LysM peptidoglycan-binding domain-containing protein [Nitrosomonas sp. HPC101]|uniref:transglycosylase SLT domain-containing protein n=1 Tax=Nitrosomonas sp. HPC101 TaxID=1658667 RepID=UPI0013695A0A|nr:transglycosylase SLT domain-containing protein [Nitrosomonas sp. HPC101]MXS85697.1 LysM peptidoglycan-binding domain-containing protein [Nitrosomonas sp. HPC101]
MKIASNTSPVLIVTVVLIFLSVTAQADGALEKNDDITVLETKPYQTEPHKQQDDLWTRIRAGFSLTNIQSQEIQQHESNFSKNQRFIDHIVERSQRYLFYIIEEVERRHMPAEIALLPIIESAFDPDAYSHRHAAGLWQFIPSTAKAFGLEQNWWHDERRDIIAATQAALDYLQMLYKMFGNWKLALAAYNWGQGSLKKAIDENHGGDKSVNYQHIDLPTETRHYISKLIAIRNVIAHPRRYGIKLKPIPNRPYFEQITITQQIDVQLAARLAGIPENEFNALNPAYHRPIIKAEDSPRTLLLPATKIKVFIDNLENYDEALVSWRVYQAQQTDTLQDLSSRYRIPVSKLAETNGISEQATLKKGQTLLVPRDGNSIRERTYLAHNLLKTSTKSPRTEHLVYTVKKGDTLQAIARRYGIDINTVRLWNKGSDRLSIGQKLTLKLTMPFNSPYSS